MFMRACVSVDINLSGAGVCTGFPARQIYNGTLGLSGKLRNPILRLAIESKKKRAKKNHLTNWISSWRICGCRGRSTTVFSLSGKEHNIYRTIYYVWSHVVWLSGVDCRRRRSKVECTVNRDNNQTRVQKRLFFDENPEWIPRAFSQPNPSVGYHGTTRYTVHSRNDENGCYCNNHSSPGSISTRLHRGRLIQYLHRSARILPECTRKIPFYMLEYWYT